MEIDHEDSNFSSLTPESSRESSVDGTASSSSKGRAKAKDTVSNAQYSLSLEGDGQRKRINGKFGSKFRINFISGYSYHDHYFGSVRIFLFVYRVFGYASARRTSLTRGLK